MKQSTDRILTTHVGSLPRPHDLLDMMRARAAGDRVDEAAWASRVRSAVAETVREQAACGVDVVSDGEMGKLGFFAYVRERLTGFEAGQPGPDPYGGRLREMRAFSEYYAAYNKRRGGDRVGDNAPAICTAPVRYQGQAAVQTDIAN